MNDVNTTSYADNTPHLAADDLIKSNSIISLLFRCVVMVTIIEKQTVYDRWNNHHFQRCLKRMPRIYSYERNQNTWCWKVNAYRKRNAFFVLGKF